MLRFAEYSVSEYCSGYSHGTWPKFSHFFDNNSRRMYSTCEGLAMDKSFIVRNVQPSGLINRSQPINVTMDFTRHAEGPGLQRRKCRRRTVEELVTVGFSANIFPATVRILSFPTVKLLSHFSLESDIDRISMFHSSPIYFILL